MNTQTIEIFPMNRVEGDLELKIEFDGDKVKEAWSVGTMYRGIENILMGRGMLDGLVITPRICGICSTSHLHAAAKALDMAFGVQIPDNAKRVRNITVMVEQIQSDLRHSFLLFMADATNPAYADHPLFNEARTRFEPMKGQTALETITQTRKIIEIIAILGGQWPHSSFMVPGGVVSLANATEIGQCRLLLKRFRNWYERWVLGCDLERFDEIDSKAALDKWLAAADAHYNSELGFFLRFGREAGWDQIGRGHDHFICFGALDLPADSVQAENPHASTFIPAGFATGTRIQPFDQSRITEDVAFAWFDGPDKGQHPFEGTTDPYATGSERHKYSWNKAPRYDGLPAETGPLAEMIMSREPLFTDWIAKDGPSVLVRQLARIVRPVRIIPLLDTWLAALAKGRDAYYQNFREPDHGQGFGLIQAPRGALGHWVRIKDRKIESYQVITPSSWNASPRDGLGVRGPWEEALVGTRVKDPQNPVELDHIVRSFDPCLVCTVHVADLEQKRHLSC